MLESRGRYTSAGEQYQVAVNLFEEMLNAGMLARRPEFRLRFGEAWTIWGDGSIGTGASSAPYTLCRAPSNFMRSRRNSSESRV